MSAESNQHAAKQDIMTMRYKYGLATRRNHPVAQRKMGTAINAISLVTVTNHPVVKRCGRYRQETPRLVTVSNHPVVKLRMLIMQLIAVWQPCRISESSNTKSSSC